MPAIAADAPPFATVPKIELAALTPIVSVGLLLAYLTDY